MSTCRDCWNCRFKHWTPAHDVFTGLARGIYGDADLIVAALVPVMEAFREQLTSGNFGRGLNAWTYEQAGLEVGAKLHKCRVKRAS